MKYKLTKSWPKRDDGALVNPQSNVEYLAWLAAGNTPDPADPDVPASPSEATIEQYGGGTGTDNTPALQRAIDDKCEVLKFGRGTYTFATKTPLIHYGLTLKGLGIPKTSLVRGFVPDHSDHALFTFTGQEGFGGGLEDLGIYSTTAGGVGVYCTGSDTTHRVAFHVWRNVWISGFPLWGRCVVYNGLGVPDQPGGGGLRDIRWDNVYLFNASTSLFEGYNIQNFWWVGGGAYAGDGPSANVIVNGQSPNARSTKVYMDVSMGGTLYLRNANAVNLAGQITVLDRDGTVDTLKACGWIGSLAGTAAANESIV